MVNNTGFMRKASVT